MDVAASKSAISERRPSASTLFLLALAALALYFCYLIASPFRAPIFLALMIAILFHPVHVRIQQHVQGKNAAALISTSSQGCLPTSKMPLAFVSQSAAA